MLIESKSASAPVIELPGRSFVLLHAPETTGSRHISMGLAIYPAGSAPAGHVHEAAEEAIYVLAGRGRLVASGSSIDLDPGVAVCIPPGVHHSTVAGPDGRLELLCVFSPPVTPGTYEPLSTAQGPSSAQGNSRPAPGGR